MNRDVDNVVLFRCFSDVKTEVWIFNATGLTTKLDLGISAKNSGLVNAVFLLCILCAY